MKKFSIGYRVIKTAVGAALAIAIAQYFDLQFYTAAGILTILSIQSTKKKSIHAVYTRIVASLISMLLGFLFFEIFGYYPLVFGIMLVIFIPIIVSLKVIEGFVSSVVIIMHIYATANFTTELLLNELSIMLIGFGMGLAVNLYMPDITPKLHEYRNQIEANYQVIFAEIAKYLRNGDTMWDGKELIQSVHMIKKAKRLAFADEENNLIQSESLYYIYFDMREHQLEIIERVLPKMTALPAITKQSLIVAEFLEDLSEHIHSGNTATYYRHKLELVREELAQLPLPTTHEMFLAQSALYQFIEEMDKYLEIKQAFPGLKLD